MKRLLRSTLFGTIVLIGFSVIAAHAATITVNTLVDENNTNAAACSLREAINNAINNNTTNGLGCVAGSGTDSIVISVNGTITLATALPTIATSVNITGNGASLLSISGNNVRRIFTINSGTVTINNLTVTSGFDSSFAGGIFNQGGTVTLSGVVVSNSNAEQAGGIQNSATMTINNSTITNSEASVFAGGGIVNYGTLTVNNSTISNNQASAQGGGIGNYANLTVNDSTFINNSSANIGGGIVNSGGTTFSVNRSSFYGNTAGSGGAIYVDSTTASTITNGTFFNNVANAGSAIRSNSTLTMRSCTVSGNRNESAVYVYSSSGFVTLINNIVAGNTDSTQTIPIDIYADFGGTIVTGSSFNNLIGTGGSGGLIHGVNGNQVGVSPTNVGLLPLGSYGGTVQTMPIRPNSPARNAGTNTGAPATDARGFNRPQATTVDIGAFEIQTNSIVTNTSDTGSGSLRQSITDITAGDVIQFESPLFDTSQTISLSTGQITLGKNLTIYGNGANLLDVKNTAAQGPNSRVFDISSNIEVNLIGMSISGGNATGSGGGITSADINIVTINGCHVRGNRTTNFGGGIFSRGVLNILNSTVSANTSLSSSVTGSGSGINISAGGTLNLTNSTVTGNSTPLGNNSGGIWSHAMAITTITNSTITNNTSTGSDSAGGVYNSGGSVTVRNSIIAANRNNTTMPDVVGAFNSQGYNLIGNRGTATGFSQPTDQSGTNPLFENSDGGSLAPAAILDPMLFALAQNGGTVPTHATMAFSPAVDKGNAFGSTTDARGLARTVDLVGYTNTSDGTDIGAYESQLAPTSSNASISGRVLTADGRGLRNAIVQISDMQGGSRTALTTSFGYFRFDDVPVGATYVISVSSKRFNFTPRVLSVTEELFDVDFIGESDWSRSSPN